MVDEKAVEWVAYLVGWKVEQWVVWMAAAMVGW